MKKIKFIRRATTSFLTAIPPCINHFDAYIYAVVKRKPHKIIPDIKWGSDVRLDPCEFDWVSKTFTITIPLNINPGIQSVEDLDPHFFEAVEVAFITLMLGCQP